MNLCMYRGPDLVLCLPLRMVVVLAVKVCGVQQLVVTIQ